MMTEHDIPMRGSSETARMAANLERMNTRPVRRCNAVAWVILTAIAALLGLGMGYVLGVVL